MNLNKEKKRGEASNKALIICVTVSSKICEEIA